jgi:hypothetical protein
VRVLVPSVDIGKRPFVEWANCAAGVDSSTGPTRRRVLVSRAKPCTDPFERAVVAVPTRGIERWLAQQLSAAVLHLSDQRSVAVRAQLPLHREPDRHRRVSAAA